MCTFAGYTWGSSVATKTWCAPKQMILPLAGRGLLPKQPALSSTKHNDPNC